MDFHASHGIPFVNFRRSALSAAGGEDCDWDTLDSETVKLSTISAVEFSRERMARYKRYFNNIASIAPLALSSSLTIKSRMAHRFSLFFLGVTGYIGGSVLVELKNRYPNAQFTALVRNPKDIAAVQAIGVQAIQGSHSDLDLIRKLASEHDVVINCGDSDDLPLTKVILAGLESRAQAKPDAQRKPILIHTSGTGLLQNERDGAFHSDKIYDDNNLDDIKGIRVDAQHRDDNNLDDIKGIRVDAQHRDVDLEILSAGKTSLIDPYIIAPCTVYGKGRGPVRNLSIQVNNMIRVALRRKELVQVGPGTNLWNSVHIDDLANLYGLLLDHALSGRDKSTDPFERFYWGSGDEYVWGDITKELARLLYARGVIQTETRKIIKVEEEPILDPTATNSRSVSNRGIALGWTRSGTPLFETLPQEVEWTLAEVEANA
ncbi:hypothetical protein FRC01_011535 [Tulasnella sp. 417]|nr:hypothetical protein FRC01_011535 [Tulasnella sp. 417]